jgi:predicted GTPase
VGHELESCTKGIQEYETVFKGKKIFLVDTPGFDDTDHPDIELLEELVDWLQQK